MFNKELKNRIKELEKTLKCYMDLVDYKNECIKRLEFKLSEFEYRETLSSYDFETTKKIIANLMEERNSNTVKKIRSNRSKKTSENA